MRTMSSVGTEEEVEEAVRRYKMQPEGAIKNPRRWLDTVLQSIRDDNWKAGELAKTRNETKREEGRLENEKKEQEQRSENDKTHTGEGKYGLGIAFSREALDRVCTGKDVHQVEAGW